MATEYDLGRVTGSTGATGAQGVSIVSVTVNPQGNLIVTLSSGTQIDAGNISGDKGDKGDKGDVGKSAYQQAKEGGYAGTEAQFVAELNSISGKAKDGDAFIPCTATYDSATKRHTLTPTQASITLPEVFTVRFIATASFAAGDKIYIGGKEYTPAYTDGTQAVQTGAWVLDTAVGITCVKTVAKAFVGAGFVSQFEKIDDEVTTLRDTKANENILRNSNFAINQRGQTTYNAGNYTVDGFRLTVGTVTVLSNGVRLSADAVDFYQTFLTSEDKRIHDGEYTISAKIDGKIVFYTMVLNFSALNTHVGGVLGTSGVYVNVICNIGIMGRFIIGLQAKGTQRIVEWIKLEEGNTATRYLQPNPASEIQQCQRYFVRLNYATLETIGTIYCTTTWGNLQIAMPCEMRLYRPTFDITCAPKDVSNATLLLSLTSVTIRGSNANLGFAMEYTPHAAYAYTSQAGYIDFDAEVY